MAERIRLRFWIETGLALLSSVLALVTILHRDWIETVFGIDPDQHNGAVEWMIICLAVAIAVSSVTLARRERRREAIAA